MYKLLVCIVCLCISQNAFTQNMKMEIEGAIIISDSESQSPPPGTIRWSGQDFEGFDGTTWRSLTGCSSDNPFSTDAELICPSNLVLDNCNLTVNWTHDNPLSNTVNYDLRLSHVSNPNGVDPGPSVTYPSTSNTVSICDPTKLNINSGSGSIDVELLYWYDGDVNDMMSAGTCTVNYDFGPASSNVFTFAEIRAAGRAENGYFDAGVDYADAHLAELLYMNPTVCNWSMDVANETITILPPEAPTGSIAYLPPPTGGNDATMIENFINANSGKSVVGTGATYLLSSTVDVNVPVKIFDVPTRITGSISIAYKVNSADVEFHECLVDANNSASLKIAWEVGASAHRFVLTRSGVKDMFRIGAGPAAGVKITGGRDFKIACNNFENLLLKIDPNDSSGSTVMRAVWSANSTPGALTPGGYIANNYAKNIHTNLRPQGTIDPEFFAVQSYDGTAGRVKVIANRCINAGKRLAKCLVPDIFVASNFYHWKDRQGPFDLRKQTAIISCQQQSSNVRVINNRFKIEGEGRYDSWITVAPEFNNYRFEELHFDYNDMELIDTPPAHYYGLGIQFRNQDSNAPDNQNQLTNCSARGNVIRGLGGTNHVFSFGAGYDDDASSLDIDLSGNIVNAPLHISVFRGSNAPLPQ